MFTRLLVGLDGSAGAEAALEAAIGLARRFKSTVLLAAVTDIRLLEAPLYETAGPLWTEGVPVAPVAADLRQTLEERGAALLQAAAARLHAAGIAADTARAVGLVDEELLRLSERVEGIVVGRRGELHDRPPTLGTVTSRIIRRATKPVLVAGDRPSPCERPVVAYDGGETSRGALALAARYADALSIPLDLVYVSDDAEKGGALLAQASAFLSEHRVMHDTHLLPGDVAPAVAGFVEGAGSDLLIAGAHGGRRRSWAIGSHAEKLLKATAIPVIIHH